MAGTCEYGDEPCGSKNAGNFLTSCRNGVLCSMEYGVSVKVRSHVLTVSCWSLSGNTCRAVRTGIL